MFYNWKLEYSQTNKYDKIDEYQDSSMNISETEAPVKLVAKTCSCDNKNKNNSKAKVTYEFVDSYHSLCLDKKDIIYAELEASDKLLKDVSDGVDKKTIESEITELKMALDLLA